MINYIKKNFFELLIFILLFVYFSFWLNLNSISIENNNNSLRVAIKLYDYKPLISSLLHSISNNLNSSIYLGTVIIPSLVGVILFKIFFKMLGQKLWSISLTLLSIFATENYPFIKFLLKLLTFSNDYYEYSNKYENFEIIGFPIPSFTILYFATIFYFTFSPIKMNRRFFLTSTFFWLIGIHIHPVDGLLGIIYWTSILLVFSILKKIKFEKIDILIIFILYLVNLLTVLSSLDFTKLNISTDQNLSSYNLIFYFIVPSVTIFAIIKTYKVDTYEFFLKFFGIYILMFSEFSLILLSLLGFGIELQMLENRISLFLLHFLYYVPIIYYLNKDPIFYEKFIEKNLIIKIIKKTLYFLFNKYKLFYLLPFSILIVFYALSSLNI